MADTSEIEAQVAYEEKLRQRTTQLQQADLLRRQQQEAEEDAARQRAASANQIANQMQDQAYKL